METHAIRKEENPDSFNAVYDRDAISPNAFHRNDKFFLSCPLLSNYMLSRKMISGILALLGVLFLVKSFSIEDIGSCPSIAPGQQIVCQHTYPGTDIYVSTVWLILDGLSALSFGAAAIVFLASTRYESRMRLVSIRAVDAISGILLISVTVGLAAGAIVEPILFGYPYFRVTGFLYGIALGLIPGVILYLLPRRSMVPNRPEIS